MTRVLVDTNILILHIAAMPAFSFIPGSVAISALSVFEALRYPGLSKDEEALLLLLIRSCDVIPITEVIADRAAKIARTKRGRVVDLLIAGTAIECGFPLVTRNTKDFKGIRGLELRSEV